MVRFVVMLVSMRPFSNGVILKVLQNTPLTAFAIGLTPCPPSMRTCLYKKQWLTYRLGRVY
jgi:hypothetical protein